MKRFFILPLLFTTSLSAQSLSERFQIAQAALNSLPKPPAFLVTGSNPTKAQLRAVELSGETFQVASLLIAATANPTEEARLKVCQQSSRAMDVLTGIEQTDGYADFAEIFRLNREALDTVRSALACDTPCLAFVNRTFSSEYVAYNGAFYSATLRLNQSDGSFQSSAGFTGRFTNLSCKDGGMTLTGSWSSGSSSGWINFYMLDVKTGDFRGSWGDFRNGSRFYQGYWNGRY